MKIVIDRDMCTGHGVCESMAALYFEVGPDDKASLVRGEVDVDEVDIEDVELAISCCPNEALRAET